jgi:hypothetical protein
MSERAKDFLERLAFTVAFVAVGLAIPYLTGLNEAWAVPIVAGLQIAKNLLAQQVGDPNTAGFTDTVPVPEVEPDPIESADDDGTGEGLS